MSHKNDTPSGKTATQVPAPWTGPKRPVAAVAAKLSRPPIVPIAPPITKNAPRPPISAALNSSRLIAKSARILPPREPVIVNVPNILQQKLKLSGSPLQAKSIPGIGGRPSAALLPRVNIIQAAAARVKLDGDDKDAQIAHALAARLASLNSKESFATSTVYAAALIDGCDNFSLMVNSATGYVGKAIEDVVKTWEAPAKKFGYSFPSNTLVEFKDSGLSRPETKENNAHAEVNEFIQHATFAHAWGISRHEIAMSLGTNIGHCAECWWAAHAIFQWKGGKFFSHTKCSNKLFKNWREPWTGFYAEYGDNPFRKRDGEFRKGWETGQRTADELNKAVKVKIYS